MITILYLLSWYFFAEYLNGVIDRNPLGGGEGQNHSGANGGFKKKNQILKGTEIVWGSK